MRQAVGVAQEWSSSDAWFMVAVALAQARGLNDLSSVIETGDYVNHSVFNVDEIERAVARLRSAGLLVELDGSYSLTAAGDALWNRAPSPLALRRLMWLEEALHEWHYDPGSTWTLDPRVYREAVRAYRERFAETLRRISRPRDS
jgi:hypothetical protein